MGWYGKLIGAALGAIIGRGLLGAIVGFVIGHLYDSRVAADLRTHAGQLAGAAAGTRKAMLAKVMEAIAARLS